jgi:hypothetical protein
MACVFDKAIMLLVFVVLREVLASALRMRTPVDAVLQLVYYVLESEKLRILLHVLYHYYNYYHCYCCSLQGNQTDMTSQSYRTHLPASGMFHALRAELEEVDKSVEAERAALRYKLQEVCVTTDCMLMSSLH